MSPKRKSKLIASIKPAAGAEEKIAAATLIIANRYKILKKLGSGSFGTAYLISDLKTKNDL